MSLTVAFLTRDDEARIARAIESARPVADQILVVDAGSNDRTVEVAQEAGAEVHRVDWSDDFAAGRHAAIGHARSDWVLWMNNSEELVTRDSETFRMLLDREDAFGYWVAVEAPGTTEVRDVRLFRNRPGLRFVGRLHPRFKPGFVEGLAAEGLQVLPSPIVLRDDPPPGPIPESKLRWIARLLELELKDRPDGLPYWIEQGRTLLILGDPRGHDAMARALEIVLKHFGEPTAPAWKVAVLLEYLLDAPQGRARTRIGRPAAAELAIRWFPSYPPLLWRLAGLAFEAGDYPRAGDLLERLVALGDSKGYDRAARFDPAIVGDQALTNLGACLVELGELDRAEAAFRRTLASPRFAEAARKNLDLVARLRAEAAGRSPNA